jgi:hypothetical protein
MDCIKNKYCKFKRCLSCYVDNQIIKASQEMEDR